MQRWNKIPKRKPPGCIMTNDEDIIINDITWDRCPYLCECEKGQDITPQLPFSSDDLVKVFNKIYDYNLYCGRGTIQEHIFNMLKVNVITTDQFISELIDNQKFIIRYTIRGEPFMNRNQFVAHYNNLISNGYVYEGYRRDNFDLIITMKNNF